MRLEEKKMNLKESSIYYESIFELKYYKDLSPAWRKDKKKTGNPGENNHPYTLFPYSLSC